MEPLNLMQTCLVLYYLCPFQGVYRIGILKFKAIQGSSRPSFFNFQGYQKSELLIKIWLRMLKLVVFVVYSDIWDKNKNAWAVPEVRLLRRYQSSYGNSQKIYFTRICLTFCYKKKKQFLGNFFFQTFCIQKEAGIISFHLGFH